MIVSKFLKKNLTGQKYNCMFGEIDLNNNKIIQNSGAVYGIFVEMENLDLEVLKKELKRKKKKINDLCKPIIIENKEYLILYFGKNVDLLPRIQQHYKTSKKTGALDLINMNSLKKSKNKVTK